jgi:hypothetical protein
VGAVPGLLDPAMTVIAVGAHPLRVVRSVLMSAVVCFASIIRWDEHLLLEGFGIRGGGFFHGRRREVGMGSVMMEDFFFQHLDVKL